MIKTYIFMVGAIVNEVVSEESNVEFSWDVGPLVVGGFHESSFRLAACFKETVHDEGEETAEAEDHDPDGEAGDPTALILG